MMRGANARPTSPHGRAGSDLCARDVDIILAHQHASGAYPASPTFPPYRYAWFRDGAFIAYAMDVTGQHESARRFHAWAVEVVLRHGEKARRAVTKARAGQPLGADYLHARYTLEGEEVGDDWPNFQLDGFGTWLWALGEHVRRTGFTLPPRWQEAVTLVADYLAAVWRIPCYDLWEEDDTHLHTYTLATIVAGLRAASAMAPGPWGARADAVQAFVLRHGVADNHAVKHIPTRRAGTRVPPQIDASLLGLAVPYGLLPPLDPRARATAEHIAATLWRPGGGVYRYPGDTYYGGGEWVLLAAWLGWYYALAGERERAQALLTWVETQADGAGHLPEQVTDHPQAHAYVAVWEARWGPVARPLLWSHAMHLVLCHALASSPQ